MAKERRKAPDPIAEHGGKKKRFSLRSYILFYTRFPIPWWLFILSLIFGVLAAETTIQISKYLIQINKGELYNGVILGYSLVYVLNAVIAMLVNVCSEYGVNKVTYRARRLLWRKILHLPMREVERRGPSALVSGVVNDTKESSNTIRIIFAFISSFYGFIRACAEMASFNAPLSMYMLLLLPLAIAMLAMIGFLQYRMMLKRYASLNTMTSFFNEHIGAAKHVKANALEDLEIASGLDAINTRYRADIYFSVMETVQVFCNSLYTTAGTVTIAVAGSGLIRSGSMPETGINDFSNYRTRVDQYLAEVLTHYQTFKGTQGAMQYVGVLLDGPEEHPDAGYNLEPPTAGRDIRLESVSFGYIPQQPVIHDLSVTIPAGKVTAIIGNNGSGKSTLLKLIQGVYPPDSGRVWFGDAAVDETKPEQLRREFGYILQHNPLFSGTVRDNISYGREDATDEEIAEAARLADADRFISALPEGYDTNIGLAGGLLSGGQRQRVAIARTLLTDPNYLLMDEAGASLDHKSDMAIYRAVREHMKGRTVVVVAHDMRTVMEADYVIVLHSGNLEAAGTNEELAKISPTYREYMEKQGFGGEAES